MTRAVVKASRSSKPKKSKSKKKPVNVRPSTARKLKNSATNTTTSVDSNTIFPGGIDLYPRNRHESVVATADLHLHSTCSDGKLTPTQVIQKASDNGLKVVSLTDHDTMAGVAEAVEAAKRLNIFVIPGVEISAEANGSENIHILGYFAPGTHSVELDKKLSKVRETRFIRGQKMLEKLRKLGIHLKWERVLEIAGEAAPGRPHVAEALHEAGHVPTFRAAFDRYLHNNGPAYVQGEHFPPEDAIRMIREAGGISVLAHPWCAKNPLTLVPKLAEAGVDGVEVYNDSNKVDLYSSLAKESNLIKTGGSDYHGISPESDRDIGDIPFSKKAVSTFLAYARDKWYHALDALCANVALELSCRPDSRHVASFWKAQEPDVETLALKHRLAWARIKEWDAYIDLEFRSRE